MAKKASKTQELDARRDAVINAAMALAAEHDWDEVRLSDIAAQAGVTLAEMRAAFESKTAIVYGLMRRTDKAVLEGDDPEMAGEPARDRLFDVLMRRFEALAPYRAALRSIMRAYRNDVFAASQFNARARRSMKWMLESAQIDATGRMGEVRAQGLVLVWMRTMRVFLRDKDEGLARTMAELDRALRDGERVMRNIGGGLRALGMVGSVLSGLRDGARRARRRRRYRDDDYDEDERRYYDDPDDAMPDEPYTGGPH